MKTFYLNDEQKQKRAVVTRARDNYEMAVTTHPVLKDYARRCKADFIVINQEKLELGEYSFEIFQCYDLFDTYERILVIDTDTLVTMSCPNLFEVVPEGHIGTIYEDKYNRKKDRWGRIFKVQQAWGDVGWRKGYINTGVILFSKCHRQVLTYEPDKIWDDLGYDDVLIGYNIHKYKCPVFELPYKFNHMSVFSEAGKNRLKSHIIHYAGRGFSGKKSRPEQIASDLQILKRFSNSFWLNFCNIRQRLRLLAIGVLNFLRDKQN